MAEIKSINGMLLHDVVLRNIFDENDIPKVFFEEAMPQTKNDVVTKFRWISKTLDFEGYAEFKAQGNSTMAYKKKNATVKMYADESLSSKLKVDFKGWGEQRKHVYKANWVDLTHARNVVSARIWADLTKSRGDYESLPELLRTSPNQGAIDGFPVKVYSQGVYQGRYTLNIPKDAWMANMDDSLEEHCILCGENYVSGCFRATANIDETDWTDEIHDVVPESILTRWNEVINFVMNSTDEEFKANLGNYFFVDSLIDYHIFGLLSCNLDGFGKNQLYFTYDGLKWIAVVYDLDATWGLYTNGYLRDYDYSRQSYEDYVNSDGNLLYVRLEKLFADEIKERWNVVKNTVLSTANIINHFERFTDIAPLDLVKEDFATTTGGGEFTAIPSQETNNIQQIREFVVNRWKYVDAQINQEHDSSGETLPDGYTELAYIECNNAQYTDTGIIPTANTGFEYKFRIEDDRELVHVVTSDNTYMGFKTVETSAHLLTKRNGAANNYTASVFEKECDYVVSAFVTDDYIRINDYVTPTALTAGTTDCTKGVRIGAYAGSISASYFFGGRIYYVRLYESGELAHNFIPCINDSGVVGLYDVVDGVFYGSSTTTSYVAGELVTS